MTKSGSESTRKEGVFRSAREFEAAMFPHAIQERDAECEREHPRVAGARLAEEALANLRPSRTGAQA
jgi:hypothetical protein